MESHDQTVARLRQLLDEGQFGEQGRMPPERDLAADLGVGRRSLRRALDVLEREGRIAREQGRGTFVRGPSLLTGLSLERISEHTSPPEVIELRLAIEPIAARLAAVRASACEIRKIQRLVEATRSAEGPDVYEQADAALRSHAVEQLLEGFTVGIAPGVEKVGGAELRSQYITNTGAGEAEAEMLRIDALEDERIGEQVGDAGRLDLEPSRREAARPHAVPIGEE